MFFLKQNESAERQSKLENEQRAMAETVKTLQKSIVEEKRIFYIYFKYSLFEI